MSDAHGSSFFYFCFWCKGEIKGDAYCTNEGCPERIDMSTRRSMQQLKNREARDNPNSIDSTRRDRGGWRYSRAITFTLGKGATASCSCIAAAWAR